MPVCRALAAIFPPKSQEVKTAWHVCRALVAIGCFTIVSSAIGYFGSQFRPVFLSLYLVVGTFATTLQLMLVLGIFGAQDKVADEIEKADSISGVKHFDKCVSSKLALTVQTVIRLCAKGLVA